MRVTGFAFEPSHPGERYLDRIKLIKILLTNDIVQHLCLEECQVDKYILSVKFLQLLY